jgi:hypothetical protein
VKQYEGVLLKRTLDHHCLYEELADLKLNSSIIKKKNE